MNDFWRDAAELARRELVRQKQLLPPEELQNMVESHSRNVRDFHHALRKGSGETTPRLLGAIQKIDPVSETICSDGNWAKLVPELIQNKCHALAAVTERHFYGGASSMLSAITRLSTVPVIRWDCIMDLYQIGQSYLWGADGITLISSILDQSELLQLSAAAAELKLHILGMAATPNGVERLSTVEDIRNIAIMGVNDPEEAEKLLQMIPENRLRVVFADPLPPGSWQDLSADAVMLNCALLQSGVTLPRT